MPYTPAITPQSVLNYFRKPAPQMLKAEEAIAYLCWQLVEQGRFYTLGLVHRCPADYALSEFVARKAISILLDADVIRRASELDGQQYQSGGQGATPVWYMPKHSAVITKLAGLWATPPELTCHSPALTKNKRTTITVESVEAFYRSRANYMEVEEAIAYLCHLCDSGQAFSVPRIMGTPLSGWLLGSSTLQRAISTLKGWRVVSTSKLRKKGQATGRAETLYQPTSLDPDLKAIAQEWNLITLSKRTNAGLTGGSRN